MTAERLAEIRELVQPGFIPVTDRRYADLAHAVQDLLAEHDGNAFETQFDKYQRPAFSGVGARAVEPWDEPKLGFGPVPTETPAERRRYALLQAATFAYWAGVASSVDDWTYSQAVTEAEKILAEIERRGKP